MQLKVLVLGNKNITRRVNHSLQDSGITLVCQNEVSESMELLKRERFDLAMVDGYMDNVESVFYHINWLYRTPVAVIINGVQNDWSLLRSLDADGFIPEEVDNVELTAYFQSILRRKESQFSKIKVLIIEDDLQTQEALNLSFQIYWPEAEVISAACGQDGVKLARAESMDVILLDMKLPDISGLEVLERIRSFSRTPVIIVSATRNQEDVLKTLTSGANDYIIKPFRQLELMSRIRQQVKMGSTLIRYNTN